MFKNISNTSSYQGLIISQKFLHNHSKLLSFLGASLLAYGHLGCRNLNFVFYLNINDIIKEISIVLYQRMISICYLRRLIPFKASVESKSRKGSFSHNADSSPGSIPFSSVVERSMSLEQTRQAWCDSCTRYQPIEQWRRYKKLPNILAMNCGLDSAQVKWNSRVSF